MPAALSPPAPKRLLRKIRSWVDHLHAIRSEKRSLTQLVREKASHLRPGPWFVAKGGYGRHWLERGPPRLLKETKLRRSTRKGSRDQVARILYRIIPPLVTRVPAGEGTHTIMIPTKGGVLLMDPGGGSVLRFAPDPDELREVARIRAEMAGHVASPSFLVVGEGGAVREQLISGRSFRHLAAAARATAWRRLTGGYASLAEARGRGSSGQVVAAALAAAEGCLLPEGLRSILDVSERELVRWAGSQPLVPAHGDVSDDNLIIDGTGSPFLIDFEARCVGELPFFHDPLLLVIREAKRGRPDLLDRIMRGQEEDVLATLWHSARVGRSHDDLTFALLAVLLVHVHRRNHIPGPPDPDRLQDHLRQTWLALDAFLNVG
jgi:hypothetical protein